MAVIGVKSITGITSITNAAGGADVLTFHSNNTTERLRIQADGGVAIGTNAVSAGDLATGTTLGLPKLHVDCGHQGNGTYHISRFRAGSDNDWNAGVLTLNHSNDRGLALYGGRSTGDRSWIAFRSIDSVGRVSNAIEILGNDGRGVQDLKFYTGDSTTTTERLRIGSTGIATFFGQIALSAGGAERFNVSHTSGGNVLVKNPTGANITFQTSSNSDQLQLHNNGRVGMGIGSPDGKLHVHSSSAGTVTADADADELALESSGNTGMSILSPATGESSIYFGNPGTNGQKDGWLKYYHESHSTTANRRCLSFKTGGGSEKMRLDSAGRLLIGVTAPSTSSSERFEVSGMSLFMNNSSTTGTVYIRNQASDAGTGHCLIFQDGSANRGAITLDNNDQVTFHGHQGILFKTGGTVGGGKEVARFNNGGGLQFKNTGCNRGIIWIQGDDACTSMANIQGSGGRGIVETKISNIPANTTTDFAKSHWGGLALIGWSGTGHQGHEQVAFGYGGTPSSQHKRQWQGNLTVTYTMSAYTLRISHNASNALNFWCILIGV